MALQFDGTNYLDYSGSPINPTDVSTEWSAFCWWYTTSDPTAPIGIAGDNDLSGGLASGHTFWVDDNRSGRTDVFVSEANNGSSAAGITGDNEGVTNGTWQCLVTTWKENDASGHAYYVDGTEQGDSPVTTVGGGGFNFAVTAYTVGRRPGGHTSFKPRSGDRIAELAYWDRQLLSAEIAGLSNGMSPLFFGGGLLWYVPFKDTSDTTDIVGGSTATEIGAGALTTGEHPPITYPSLVFPVGVGAAAPTADALDLDSAGIASGEAFGLHSISEFANLDLGGAAISSGVAFGEHSLREHAFLDLDGQGIAPSETFGEPSLREHASLDLSGAAIASSEAFGEHSMVETRYLDLDGAAIPTGIAFGAPSLREHANIDLNGQGIPSGAQIGTDINFTGGVPFVGPEFQEGSVSYGESVSTEYALHSSQAPGTGSANVRGKQLRRT